MNKASGPDNIPDRVLKECAAVITQILQCIFQKSIATGTLPQDCCEANVLPIYKKDDRSDPANNHPVSLTSIVSKLLEHIIHHHIMVHMDKHSMISENQHGFRKCSSCETQLVTTVQDLANSLNSRS